MKQLYNLKTIILTIGLILTVSVVHAQITSTATGGNWSNGSTWVGGVVPGTAVPVVIATTGTNDVEIDATLTHTGSVTVNNGARLSMTTILVSVSLGSLTINAGGTVTAYRDFTVTGATSISGTINFGSTSTTNRTMTFTGDVTLNSGAVWNETTTGAVADFSFGGNLTNNATTFTAQNNTSAVHIFTGSTKTLNGTTITAIPYLTINGTTTNSGTLTVSAILAGTGTLTNDATGTLNIGGTAAITTLNAGATGNNVNYNGAAQTCKVTTYDDLTLKGSGIKTFVTTPTVNGILSMEETATVSVTTGVVTYGSAATLQYNTATSRTATSEEWITSFAGTGGVKIANTGTITMNEAKVFNTSAPLTINALATLATANNQLTFGGNFVNGGTFTAGSSPIVIASTMVTQSIAGFTTTGLVSMIKGSGTATFTGNVNGAGLTINGSGTLNLGSGLTHTFTGTWTRTTGTLNGGSSTLRLGSSVTNTAGTFTASTGTVEYYLAGIQTVAPLTYNNLTLSGTSAKTFPTGTTTVNSVLSMEGTATTTVTGTLTYGGSSTLQYKGSGTQTTGSEFISPFTGSGGVKINNTSGVTLGSARSLGANPLTIGDVIPGSIFNDAGFQLTGTGTLNLISGTFKLGLAAAATTFPSFGTRNITTGTTVEYAATTIQTIKGLNNYSNLTISGTGTNSKTADGDITVNGILNLSSTNASATQGCLSMSTFILNMGASAATTGSGDVTGIVKRTQTFANNTQYSFGSQFTTITFLGIAGSTKPAWISCKIAIGLAPSWRSTAVRRVYTFAQDGTATDEVITNLRYLDSELNAGETDESRLVLWDAHNGPSWSPVEPHGKSNNDASNNWIGLSGLTITYLAPTTLDNKQWGLSYSTFIKNTWLGVSTDWSSTSNWSAGHAPLTSEDVLIPAGKTFYPVLTASVEVTTLEIASGASLTAGSNNVTINGFTGAWNNSGTFIPNTGTVIFSNGNLANIVSMNGTTNFNNITVNDNTYLQPATGSYLRIAGTVSAGTGSIIDLKSTSNTVEYNGSGQNILNFPGPASDRGYYDLIINGSGTTTLPAVLDVLHNFTLNGGTAAATASSAIHILGNVILASGTTFTASNSSITVSGNWTNNGAAFTPGTSTVTFNNTLTAQTINGTAVSQTFYNVVVDKTSQSLNTGGSTTSLAVNNLTETSGNFTAPATLTINGNAILTAGTFIAGTTTNLLGNLTNNGATLTAGSGTVNFNGSSTQTISGTAENTFNNLTIYKTAPGQGVSASTNQTVNGILNLNSPNHSATQGALDMGAFTLDMGANGTTIGTGDVTGTVRRTTIVAGTTYTLGNQYSSVSFPGIGTLPSSISLTISIGSAPGWKTDAILRHYTVFKTGGFGTESTLRIHYLDSELNANTENLLVPFVYFGGSSVEGKRSDFDITNNFITISNLSANLPSGTEFTLGNSTTLIYTWTGTTSTDWNTVTNWSSAIVPTPSSNVIIPDAGSTNFDPSLPLSSEISTINIQTNGILNAVSGAQLILNGSSGTWICDGTFNPDNSTVIFTNSSATVSGTSNFYNIIINTGTRLGTQLGAVIGIAGTVTNNGVWSTVSQGPTTVNYNGGNQTVVIPNASDNRYSTLILSGTGIKTMPNQEIRIMGDFSLNGTASATAAQDLNITGNLSIGAGTAFNSSSWSIIVGGNWINNGTFSAATGTVVLNGSSVQTISGNNIFNNLTINSAGVAALSDQTVNGVLYLQSANASAFAGSLDMGANILDMGALATTTGTGDVTGITRRITFVPQTSYSFGNQFTTVLFIPGGTYPASLQVKLTIGTVPDWKPSAIKRIYELVNTGGSNCFANISLHYLDAELNGNPEARLVKFRLQTPSTITEMGRSNYNLTDNWIENDQVGIGLLPTSFGQVFISMAETGLISYTWNGSLNSVWENTSNWTPVGSPSDLSNIIIPDGGTTPNDPTLKTGGVSLQSISIENGGILNSGDQLLTLGGTSGTWINNGTFNAGSGTVTFTGNGATISGTTDFYNLTISPGADVTNQIGSYLRIGGTMTNNGTWRAALLDNTVEYNGVSQAVLNTNAPIPGYHNLILGGSGTKTMPGTALSVYGDFTVSGTSTAIAGAAMTIGGNVSVEAGATLDLGSFSHTISGNLTNTDGTLSSTGSSITFDGKNPQTITSSGGITLNNLTITNTNATLGPSTDCTIGGNLTVSAGTVFDLTANMLTAVNGSVANSGTIRTQNTSTTPVPTGKTWDGTLEYYGDAAQTIGAGTYNNLTKSGSGGATAVADIIVNGILNLSSPNPSSTKGSLDLWDGSAIKTLTMDADATNIGIGDITGIIKRTTLSAGVTYTFGNPFMSVFFTNDGTRPSEMSAKISIGTAPSWRPGAINREVEIIQTGGTGTKALFSYHYLDAELNANDEGHLVFWVSNTPDIEYGRSANNSTENWVSLSNVNVAFFSSTFDGTRKITLDEYSTTSTLTWNGSLSDSWTSVENWTPNIGPSLVSDIIIPDALTTPNDPTLPGVTEIKSLNIESGGILNSAADAQLTLNGSAGAWINNGGSFNPGTSNVIFTGADASISGTTDFYNVTIASGAKLQNQTGSVIRISGSMTNTGTWDAGSSDNTVEYNGPGTQVVAPETYDSLILAGSGSKTTSGITVNGILSIEGTSTASDAPNYGTSAALQYNTATPRAAGPEWITTFRSTGGVIIANTGTISLDESKVLGVSVPLTINSGSVLTIGAPYSLTVDGNITNNAGPSGLVIQSDATSDGKLINNTSPVSATVELYLTGGTTGGNKFHFFVPPVSTMGIGSTLQNVKQNLGISNFNNDLMSYSESAAGADQNKGWQYYDGFTTSDFTYAPFSDLVSSKGYNIYLTADDKITFKGTLNATPHTFSLNRSPNCLGWNLVGNPYPCNYDLKGISALTTADNGVDKSVYFGHNGTYVYYNMNTGGTFGYTSIVPPMQGFFIHVTASGNSLLLPAGSKIESAANPRSKGADLTEPKSIEKINLALSNATVSDETLVCLIDKATTGFDGEYDAYKLFGNGTSIPDIYTELNSVKYAINSVPGPQTEPVIIPVTVVLKTQGTYKIDIKEFENLEGTKVVLKHGAVETNLSKDASYSFTSAAGTFRDFELIIGGAVTGIENLPDKTLKTWYNNNFLYINCPAEITADNGNLTIYDMQGKPVYNNNRLYLTPGQTIQLPLILSKGVYITYIIINNQPFISKIVIL